MRDLWRKMFWTLFGILSALSFAITGMVALSQVSDMDSQIRSNLIQVASAFESLLNKAGMGIYADYTAEDQEGVDFPEYTLISDLPTYTIAINRNDYISRVLYSNTDEQSANDIQTFAEEIIHENKPLDMSTGSLFTEDYAWYYSSSRMLTIVQITSLRTELLKELLFLVLLLAFFEIIMYMASMKIANWLITPIEKTFDKQKQFVADASHELKTPVAVIMASAEAMEHDNNPKWLKNIEDEAGRMNSLITDLLDLTRSEQAPLVKEEVDLSRIVEKQCMIQEAVIFEKQLTMEENIAPDIYVAGESSALVQVFRILLDNAIAHSTGKIDVSLEPKGKECVLTVSNSGDPIPESEREKIFERFYRSDNSRERSSNRYGLGLAIAKNIVLRHEGTIFVQCANGMTSFVVKLKTVTRPTQE
jgi:signal transduction histidine kinase